MIPENESVIGCGILGSRPVNKITQGTRIAHIHFATTTMVWIPTPITNGIDLCWLHIMSDLKSMAGCPIPMSIIITRDAIELNNDVNKSAIYNRGHL